jgi:iron only hydrogenase large subunit-like protein
VVVGLMSRVKSPQQVMGSILKGRDRQALVVSVMPCYDKKLEAIRFDIENGLKEVDITITTVELLELYKTVSGRTFAEGSEGVISRELPKVDRLFACNADVPYCLVEDPVSNGYVDSLIKSLKGTAVSRK